MARDLKFVFMPVGSVGDVHPLVWLGKLLHDRGRQVVLLAQEAIQEVSRRAGLVTVPWGDAAEHEAVIGNPDLWNPRKSFNIITRYVPKWAAESLPVLKAHIVPGRTVLVGGALAFGARIASECWNVPLLTAHLQPSIFMSIEDSPVMVARGEWIPRAPRWVRRGFFATANWMADRKMSPGIEKARGSVGLRGRVKGLMRQYWHSPDGVLCLFPEWYAARAADWPPQAVHSRFPLYDESCDHPADSRLEAFLESGQPPVVITPGSANAHAREFLIQATQACRLLQRRALVITRFPGQVGQWPDNAALFEYVPFGQVFGRAAAVIHHGGIGTVAQCLAAGVPQLIMPMSHDQPDNAYRVRRMGVGQYLYPRAFRAPAIAAKLSALMDSPQVKAACERYRGLVASQMSPQQTADLVESMGERALRVRRINSSGLLP